MGNRSWSDLSRYPFIEIESDVIRKQRMKAPIRGPTVEQRGETQSVGGALKWRVMT